MWIITGKLNDDATAARWSTSKSFGPATSMDSLALTPPIISRLRPIARAPPRSARRMSRVALGQDTGTANVDQNAALLRRRFQRQ
jgi:hypothetical protein